MWHVCMCLFLLHAADKEWKRKYFQEKKFTSMLEDRIRRTKDDIQQLQGHLDRKQGNHLKGYNQYTPPMLRMCSLVPRP